MKKKIKSCILLIIMLLSFHQLLFAQANPAVKKGNALQFLIGKWHGEGKGEPGNGAGSFTFAYDLDKNIITRKSQTIIPSRDGKTVQKHEDFMVIYMLNEDILKAIYFDNEGHSINYSGDFSQDKNELTFLSEVSQSAPRFRLVYTKLADDKVNIRFDIAPPGKPEAFSTYIEGISVKEPE